LLYGLPELVFDVENDLKTDNNIPDDLDDLDTLNNTNNADDTFLDDKMYVVIEEYIRNFGSTDELEQSLIQTENGSVQFKRRYDQTDTKLHIPIPLSLSRVPEDEYIGLDAHYLIWFYTYYMRADDNRNVIVSEEDSKVVTEEDGLEYQLYPIYRTSVKCSDIMQISTDEYTSENLKKVQDALKTMDTAIDKYVNITYSDFSDDSDSFDDLDTLSTQSEQSE
jgi:hypothetical protein